MNIIVAACTCIGNKLAKNNSRFTLNYINQQDREIIK